MHTAALLAPLLIACILSCSPLTQTFYANPAVSVPQHATPTQAPSHTPPMMAKMPPTATKVIQETFALGRGPFKTFDPFLFCVYHNDAYPEAYKDTLGPNPSLLRGRDIGMDFSYEDGWSMYHGRTVPGFPAHPHRGFETITVTKSGLVDHSDSLKCTARYGDGDTQWMNAGRGVQHSEMFPLLKSDEPNKLELFQIWLNLPRKSKFCQPYFTMFWRDDTPVVNLPVSSITSGGSVPSTATVKVIAGVLNGAKPLPPPPDSWAADPKSDVALWVVEIPAGGALTLPPAHGGTTTNRAIYFVAGQKLDVANGETALSPMTGARVKADVPLALAALHEPALVLLLQGRPIGEPVAQHGPFVMNTRDEIADCFDEYRRTEFGGWPWPQHDHCHSRATPRHALHADGRTEYPTKPA